MSAPYVTQAINGYDSNPPSDDGSAVSANRTTWAGVKTKLSDPIKTQAAAIDGAIVTAFGKVIGGGGVTSYSTDSTVQTTDQGKLVRLTASLTLTTPDATTVLSPFVFGVLNNSSSSCTFTGSGGQTIDGTASVTIPPGTGFMCFTDSSNWFTTGRQGTLLGAQLMYGDIINGTIVETNTSNAVTFALKTLAGNDPSATDPVLVCFRNSTLGTGNYVYRTITAATSLVISSGSTMGTSNNVACKLWLVLFDDGGTIRIGAINCLSGTNIYPLGQVPRASSTAEGGAGGADSAQVFYTGTAVTNKAYVVFGYASYESGLSTAGSWNVHPDRIELYGPGVPLPGQMIQSLRQSVVSTTPGSTAVPEDDTIPQNTEGDQYLTRSITPTSSANILEISAQLFFSVATNVRQQAMSLYQDSTANALTTAVLYTATTSALLFNRLEHQMLAGTTSLTTFNVRQGNSAGNTTTVNGVAGSRQYGGTLTSWINVTEVMA